jgi:hypothetical protein
MFFIHRNEARKSWKVENTNCFSWLSVSALNAPVGLCSAVSATASEAGSAKAFVRFLVKVLNHGL